MSNKNVFQAVREALGDGFINDGDETSIGKRANELKEVYPDANHDELVVEAIREKYGTNNFNHNVQIQVKNRVSALNKRGEAPPAPGTQDAKDTTPNEDPNAGKDFNKTKKVSITGDNKNVNAEQKKAFEEGRISTGSGGDTGPAGAGTTGAGGTVGGTNPSTPGQGAGVGAGSRNVNTYR